MTSTSRRTIGATAAALALAVAATACSGGTGAAASASNRSPAAAGARTATTSPAPATPSTSAAPATTAPTTLAPATTAPATTPPAAPVAVTGPADLTPPVTPALPGEGVWQPVPGSATAGRYAVWTTHMRATAGGPEAGVAWIDMSVTRLALYAGESEPQGSWPQQGYVAAAVQPGLLAAFNSGFKVYVYRTGWFEQGRTAVPLQAGAASLVIRTDGSATVGEWGRDVGPGPAVAAVRQNLHLLVDHGAPASDAAVVNDWGATLGGVVYTWRSGVGVTAAGDLVYVGGPDLDPAGLARLLIAAGAVRAMELDINPEWVSFSTFTHAGPGPSGAITGGTNLVPGMYFSPDHFLQPFSRDFFAVLAR